MLRGGEDRRRSQHLPALESTATIYGGNSPRPTRCACARCRRCRRPPSRTHLVGYTLGHRGRPGGRWRAERPMRSPIGPFRPKHRRLFSPGDGGEQLRQVKRRDRAWGHPIRARVSARPGQRMGDSTSREPHGATSGRDLRRVPGGLRARRLLRWHAGAAPGLWSRATGSCPSPHPARSRRPLGPDVIQGTTRQLGCPRREAVGGEQDWTITGQSSRGSSPGRPHGHGSDGYPLLRVGAERDTVTNGSADGRRERTRTIIRLLGSGERRRHQRALSDPDHWARNGAPRRGRWCCATGRACRRSRRSFNPRSDRTTRIVAAWNGAVGGGPAHGGAPSDRAVGGGYARTFGAGAASATSAGARCRANALRRATFREGRLAVRSPLGARDHERGRQGDAVEQARLGRGPDGSQQQPAAAVDALGRFGADCGAGNRPELREEVIGGGAQRDPAADRRYGRNGPGSWRSPNGFGRMCVGSGATPRNDASVGHRPRPEHASTRGVHRWDGRAPLGSAGGGSQLAILATDRRPRACIELCGLEVLGGAVRGPEVRDSRKRGCRAPGRELRPATRRTQPIRRGDRSPIGRDQALPHGGRGRKRGLALAAACARVREDRGPGALRRGCASAPPGAEAQSGKARRRVCNVTSRVDRGR